MIEDMFGDEPEKAEIPKPTAAELEAEGQASMFGDSPVTATPASEPAAVETPVAEATDADADADAPPPWDEAPSAPMAPPAPSTPAPVAAPVTAATPYRVLARKYRPQSFAELIGQDAMVQTLANAIARGRIAHAFLMTGVRGVGKTSTARLIAKALNCIGADGQGGPTITPCGVCEPCRAIAEGRHIDVIEMDAASNTGVDDMREVIDAVRYASVSARYKIYIIDEVHMLSKNAWNALLKTLEEPPAHVKFIFATTEVNKVPVTVLSRCQRFDLKRIPAEALAAHFGRVAEAEGVSVEDEALQVVARAAEGSARDGLSILDQAIAHADGTVRAEDVRDMLGLADRGRTRRLFASLIEGDVAALLGQIDESHSLGLDPAMLLRGLMETVHGITRAKAGAADDVMLSREERDAASRWASELGWAPLHRMWQLLLKGLQDVQVAPDPHEAATMALLRVVHAASLPDPATLLSQLQGEGTVASTAPRRSSSAAPASPTAQHMSPPPAEVRAAPTVEAAAPDMAVPAQFDQFVERLGQRGKHALAFALHDQVGLIHYAPGEIVVRPLRPLGTDFARDLAAQAKDVFGLSWTVRVEADGGAPSLRQQEAMAEERLRAAALDEPLPAAVRAAFPDSEFESLQVREA